MAQVSKRPLSAEVWEQLWTIWLQAMAEAGKKELVGVLFGGLLTKTEQEMLGKRLLAMALIKSGWNAMQVSELLKMSYSTIYKLKQLIYLNNSLAGALDEVLPKMKPREGKVTTLYLMEMLEDILAGYRDRGRLIYGKVPNPVK